jgi:hypothetical protein
MKQAMDMEDDIKTVMEWLSSNSHSANGGTKNAIRSLWWAYKEVKERNEILNKVLIEAAARGMELRAVADAKAAKSEEA